VPAFFCRAGWQPDVSPTVSPMPPGFDHRHPGGMIENSPAFQRWDRSQRVLSPEGTAEERSLSRPFGTCRTNRPHPALKRWAILACPFGTGAKTRRPGRALGSNPSDIGRPGRICVRNSCGWEQPGALPAPADISAAEDGRTPEPARSGAASECTRLDNLFWRQMAGSVW